MYHFRNSGKPWPLFIPSKFGKKNISQKKGRKKKHLCNNRYDQEFAYSKWGWNQGRISKCESPWLMEQPILPRSQSSVVVFQ